MKFAAVILLACVAVSSAAFTANLVQHTQPAVAQAMFNIRLAVGNKGVSIPAIDGIIAQIQNTVNSLLQQASAVVAQGQAISQALQQQLQQAVQTLQSIGGATATQIQQVIQNFLNGVTGAVGGNKALPSISDIVAAAQNAVQQAVQLAQSLINQIDLNTLIPQAINAVLPANIAQLVIAHLGMNNKGIIGDLFGNLWDQVTGAAGTVAQQIGSLVAQIATVGQSAFAEVQAQASQFLSNVGQGVAHMSTQAAQQILSHIQDLQGALGDQYDAVVAALNGIVINGRRF